MRKREVVVFHSALGLRPGLLQWAQRLRDAGHWVHTPDLYDGEVFHDVGGAVRKIQEIGFDGMLERSMAAVSQLPEQMMYVGFSNGGACAELLAATRPGAEAAILIGAPLPIRELGWDVWPGSVPVQVHFSENDARRSQPIIDRLKERVLGSGARFEEHTYAGSCHHLADPDWPDYNADAAALVFDRVVKFLDSDCT
jgi:dienelactone hydrolase